MKRFLIISAATIALAIVFCGASYQLVSSSTQQEIFSRADELNNYDVALVLGTSRYTKWGGENQYFRYRIDAAAELYFSGKVKKILVSGDNGKKSYNEPRHMYQALLERGIPREDIVLDYAGFRTFDSVVRAREIFGQNKFVVVSQKFHLERAIYIANSKNMDVVGYTARDPQSAQNKLFTREILARTKAILDCYVLGTAPRFLGEKVDINI